MSKFVCPFCLISYPKSKVKYVCPDCGKASERGFMEKEPVKCKENGCGGLATQRMCPNCGEEIPKTSLETKNLPFSIVGVSTAGKTNYITVMLNELSKTPGLQLALGAQNIETQNHQEENRDLMYNQHQSPDSTPGGEKTPQIWYIKNLKHKKSNRVPTYTFTIFDGAGEDHSRLTNDVTACRYISTSKAIILVLDPLILSGLNLDKDKVSASLGGGQQVTTNSENIVNGVSNYIRSAIGASADSIIKVPVAVVLTKFDMLLNHSAFSADALIKKPSLLIKDGSFNESEMLEIDAEIRNWLQMIGETKFINAIESNFKDFHFFAVSSLGGAPNNDLSLPEIKPHRVLDPILWLFHNEKFID